MKRNAVNPWKWSIPFGFNQGELIEAPSRTLYCAGQTAVDTQGKPQHDGDLAAQITLALDNLESVLAEAGMSLSNVVRLTVYTTDVDAMIQNFSALTKRLAAADVRPAQTLLGVARLAFPGLMVELEATAVS